VGIGAALAEVLADGMRAVSARRQATRRTRRVAALTVDGLLRIEALGRVATIDARGWAVVRLAEVGALRVDPGGVHNVDGPLLPHQIVLLGEPDGGPAAAVLQRWWHDGTMLAVEVCVGGLDGWTARVTDQRTTLRVSATA
jgi:hypothetical protein